MNIETHNIYLYIIAGLIEQSYPSYKVKYFLLQLNDESQILVHILKHLIDNKKHIIPFPRKKQSYSLNDSMCLLIKKIIYIKLYMIQYYP